MWDVAMGSARQYRIIPYPSEHVLVDGNGKRIAAFPTEKEADEYLEELLEEMADTDLEDGNKNVF